MLLIFTLLLTGYHVAATADGCEVTTVSQDIIFMIDYSGSICSSVTCCNQDTMQVYSIGCEYYTWQRCCVNEWEGLLNFTKSVIDNQLPSDSRVAALGFGVSSGVSEGWYHLGQPASKVWKTVQEASENILNVYKVGGATYLAAGIDWLLNWSPIKWDEDTDRKRILMVLTDGDANDGNHLCAQAPELRSRGIETVVVGITDDFISDTVSCLVDDVDKGIIQVSNWNDLSTYVDTVGGLTCEATQVWELTEVKAGGSEKYIEFVNTAAEFDGESIIRVHSNLLDVSVDITGKVIPQASTIVIGSPAIFGRRLLSATCEETDNCFYIHAPFSDTYVNDPSKTDDWEVEVEQVFTSSGQDFSLKTVKWDNTFPSVGDDRSLELSSLGFDNTAGSNWRRSCALGGSFGTKNAEKCPACSDPLECNPTDQLQADWVNTCGDTGCVCVTTGYYDGNNTGSCLPIPRPQNCRFLRDADHPEKDKVVWDAAAGSRIYGYDVSAGGQRGQQFSSNLEYSFPDVVDGATTVYVASIGEYFINDKGQYVATRASESVPCVDTAVTSSPTPMPTPIPTKIPTLYQPLVFLSGYEIVNDEIQPLNYTFDMNTKQVDVRIYLSPPVDVEVYWRLLDSNGVTVETGSLTFPANALEQLKDTQQATITGSHAVGQYKFQLRDTNDTLPNDPTGRQMYEVYTPGSIVVNVNPTPLGIPTMAPTEYQPLALLSGFTVNADDTVKPIQYHSAEPVKISVRISPAPADFEVNVLYKVTDKETNKITETGIVNFPMNAFVTGADIQEVTLVNCTLNTTESEREWIFELLETSATIPTDPSGVASRKTYELYTPTTLDIVIERWVDDSTTVTETETEETLDWWLILIIVLIAAGVVAVVGYFGYIYYVSWKVEKEKRMEAEENLAFEEDGIGGFFDRAGINNTQENPLHAKKVVDPNVNRDDDMNAQMVFVDDDAPFSMSVHNKEYEQRQIEVDSDGNRMQQGGDAIEDTDARSNNLSVDSNALAIGRNNDSNASWGEQSPSTYQIEDGTLPPAFT